MSLRFDATRWRTGRVTGTEDVTFTPDKQVCELVFRLWPNKPATAAAGDLLTLGAVSVNGASSRVTLLRASSGSRPTLAEVALPRCVAAQTVLKVRLAFSLQLGTDVPERVGRSSTKPVAWFASAHPMLAWEHGVGWMRDPATKVFGESAGSEAFELTKLAVVTATGDDVQGTGVATGRVTQGSAVVHSFRAPSVRDVAVAVGDLDRVERTVGAVRIHVATVGTPRTAASIWADSTAASVRRLAELFGPFPYPDLWVTVLPGIGGGIEYPGAIYFDDTDQSSIRALVPHEVAHNYFYGLVGDNQGRDPWLDEAFATYAEAMVTGEGSTYLAPIDPHIKGHLGAPMTYWAGLASPNAAYYEGVYIAGARALLDARKAAGAAQFDAALRAYVAENAHRIVTPADVEEAFAGLPAALAVLRRAGAFSAG